MRATQLTTDVFSTPAMIGLMEGTCVRLMASFLDENEQTVGIHVDVRHMAPTKDKKVKLAVSAVNDHGIKIGEGTHRRALINTTQFVKPS